MSMKNFRWTVVLLLCGLVAVFVVQPWKTSQEMPGLAAGNKTKISSKSERQAPVSVFRNPTVAAAWKKISLQNRGSIGVPTDAAKTRARFFEAIIDDKLKSLDLGVNGASRLLVDFELIDELRIELEAPMVEVQSFQDGVLKLHISSYPELGQDMRDVLQATLAQDFSMEQSEAIMERAGSDLALMYHGFGTMDQTFIVTQSDAEDGRLRVDWRLALPQVPSNGTLAATGSVWGGSSWSVTYPLSSFDDGSLAALRPALQKHFGSGASSVTN